MLLLLPHSEDILLNTDWYSVSTADAESAFHPGSCCSECVASPGCKEGGAASCLSTLGVRGGESKAVNPKGN